MVRSLPRYAGDHAVLRMREDRARATSGHVPLWPPLALVPADQGGDADFGQRFREDRIQRWRTGVRNGVSLTSLLRYRIGIGRTVDFHGAPVEFLDFTVTMRAIEDIWMAGAYDFPGYIPQRGWRVIDVGANVGIFSMLAASRGARVVSYEPHPQTAEVLARNTLRWGVECHQRAVVGTNRGPVRLFVHGSKDNRNTLLASEAARDAGGFTGTLDVPAITIGEALADGCDLLKIDCEGGEFDLVSDPDVMRAARRLVVEVHGSAGDPDQFSRHVRKAGFDVQLHAAYPGTDLHMLTATRS